MRLYDSQPLCYLCVLALTGIAGHVLVTAGEGMGVLAVIGVLLVAVFDGVVYERGDGFLSVVKVHESPNFALHVLLVAGVLESSVQLEGFVNLHERLFAVLHFSSVHVNLGLGVSKYVDELCRRENRIEIID